MEARSRASLPAVNRSNDKQSLIHIRQTSATMIGRATPKSIYKVFRSGNASGRLLIPPTADAIMCDLDARVLTAHQLVDSCGEFRFQRTFIRVLCAVFALLNTFQQRVISSSEIFFGFEPRSVKHSRKATARIGSRSPSRVTASVSSARKRARCRLCCWK